MMKRYRARTGLTLADALLCAVSESAGERPFPRRPFQHLCSPRRYLFPGVSRAAATGAYSKL
ncbi:hypothetical protein CUR178_06152 [Leishmania enriettii]|uniref:Uncharacterized protein n=1 Tax=Leishmania enriettii TaxID=5663 RepID=A0A836HNL7_LEIEN|nr:hypothetical protein CUR178_06152 [Leishmania enriettii]